MNITRAIRHRKMRIAALAAVTAAAGLLVPAGLAASAHASAAHASAGTTAGRGPKPSIVTGVILKAVRATT